MITVQQLNRLDVSLTGLTERQISLNRGDNALSINLVPFLRGQDAVWETLTQAQYDALPTKNPETLYLIVE